MKLLVQPGDSVRDLVKGIASAKSSIEAVIFRFDELSIEQALTRAVRRGVAVKALIASTNSAGEENLRQLELRLLGAGITVARTDNDLVRYHGKMMIVDHRVLYLFGFNWTHADIERSRSFGLITRTREAVQDAVRLFEADAKRIPYAPATGKLVVSPLNARKTLGDFLRGAKKSLAIYDPKVSDRAMLRVLEERAAAGVEIRIIGRLVGKIAGVKSLKLRQLRLHTRTIVRDENTIFLGSQSLRKAELDERREIGLIFRNAKIAGQVLRCFNSDWAEAEPAPAMDLAKKVAAAVTRELPPVAPIVTGAVRAVVEKTNGLDIVPDEVGEAVKGAVKEAVKEAVRDVMEEVLDAAEHGAAS